MEVISDFWEWVIAACFTGIFCPVSHLYLGATMILIVLPLVRAKQYNMETDEKLVVWAEEREAVIASFMCNLYHLHSFKIYPHAGILSLKVHFNKGMRAAWWLSGDSLSLSFLFFCPSLLVCTHCLFLFLSKKKKGMKVIELSNCYIVHLKLI